MPRCHEPCATARRSRRFSDSPCKCRGRTNSKPTAGSQCFDCLGLHQRIVVLEAAKEELSNLAALQREELQYLNNRYQISSLAQDFEELQGEKAQLEDELVAYRSAPARLRNSRQAEAQHAAAREAWLLEKESLQAEVAAASSQVASSREKLELQRQQLRSNAQRQQRLREELAKQRQECKVAEEELQRVSASAPKSLPRQPPVPPQLVKMRSEINSLAEQRRQCTDDLRIAKEDLETLHRELAAISADNAQLRSGLHSVMVALDEVQRQL